MQGLCTTVLLLTITRCLSQAPRPTFPDVFQTEIEGTFIEEDGVLEIDATMFYDRTNNRGALFVTKEGGFTKLVYNFDGDETFSIDGNDCDVQEIPEGGFFPFTMVNGRKKLSSADEAFLFTESSEQESQTLAHDILPTIVYKAEHIKVKQFEQENCTLIHVFSKPELELPSCREGDFCNSTLMIISVQCWNENGGVSVNHFYQFSKFVFEIQDESVFLPPPGVHCDIKNTKEIPPFSSYFSLTYDIIQRQRDSQDNTVFNRHKKVWYDSEYKIIRIDEFDDNGLLLSSKIYDLKAGIDFTIIATVPSCAAGSFKSPIQLHEVTSLPKSFFYLDDSNTEKEVYVGKRKVHGLDYEVWSRMWSAKDSDARIVEEMYFLQIIPNAELSPETDLKKPYFQISHVDTYTYEMSEESNEYELVLLQYFSINNFRTNPKEWAAFDVSACYKNNQRKEFSMKVKGPSVVKESQFYTELLALLYNKIISVTGVSIVRISELRGIFDGIKLIEIRGYILDNSESLGWPKNSKEPGTDKTLKLIKKAASENKLSVTFTGDDNKKIRIDVTSVEEIQPPAKSKNCYSGASLAAASLILLLIGISFGVAGYYVFLKKRRSPANIHVKMSELDPSLT